MPYHIAEICALLLFEVLPDSVRVLIVMWDTGMLVGFLGVIGQFTPGLVCFVMP